MSPRQSYVIHVVLKCGHERFIAVRYGRPDEYLGLQAHCRECSLGSPQVTRRIIQVVASGGTREP